MSVGKTTGDTPAYVFSALKLLRAGELRDTHGELPVCSCLEEEKKKTQKKNARNARADILGRPDVGISNAVGALRLRWLQASADWETPGLLHGLEKLCPQP